MKRYLITGGTGFIGSRLTRALVKQGNFVRVFDNNFRGSEKRLSDILEKIEVVEGDIRQSNDVEKACTGIDCIIHLAYINGTKFFYEQPELVLEIAVKGITNILDAGRLMKVPEFFLASSSEVYQSPPVVPTPESVPLYIPDPYNPRYSYGGGKIISELMTIHYGKKYFKKAVIFRPHNIYGPDMGQEHVIPEVAIKIKEQINNQTITIPIQGKGDETRSFMYIDDFIEGLLLILEKGRHLETYNIGTLEEITIATLINTFGNVLNKKISIISEPLREGSVKRRCPDATKLTRLGFSPKTSLAEGIRKTVAWYIHT